MVGHEACVRSQRGADETIQCVVRPSWGKESSDIIATPLGVLQHWLNARHPYTGLERTTEPTQGVRNPQRLRHCGYLMISLLNLYVRLYHNGSMVAGFGIMNTAFIRATDHLIDPCCVVCLPRRSRAYFHLCQPWTLFGVELIHGM